MIIEVSESALNLMGARLNLIRLTTNLEFSIEDKGVAWLRDRARLGGWKFHKIDTINQMGFPDVLLLKGVDYWLIECKRLKKKALNNLADDLAWQPGQLSYFKRSLTLNLNYVLTVFKNNEVIIFTGENNASTFSDANIIG